MTIAPADNVALPSVPSRDLHRIVVVGGGAGGLELVTRLGDTLGRRAAQTLHWSRKDARIFGSRCSMRSPPAAWTFHGMSWTISPKPIGMDFDTDSAK